jgi:hypothetical protein
LFDVFYAAHVAACRSKGQKPATKEAIIDVLDEVDGGLLQLQETMLRGKMLGFSFSGEGEAGNPQTP